MGDKELEKSSKAANLKKNSVICFIGNGIYLLPQFLINMITVRALGYADNGVLSLAIAVTSPFYVIALFNIHTYQVSDYNNTFSSGEYIGQRIVNSVAAMVMCVVYSLICGYSGINLTCIIGYMVYKLTNAVFDVYHAIFHKYYKWNIIGYLSGIRGIFDFISYIVGIVVTGRVDVAVWIMAIESFVMIFVLEIPQARKLDNIGPQFNLHPMLRIYKIGVRFFVYSFLLNILTLLPRNILEHYHGSEALGIFASVAAPVFALQFSASLILTPVVNLLTDAFAARDREKFYRLCVYGSGIILLICLGLLAGVYFFGDWLLVLLFKEGIAPYTYLFMPLAVSTVFVVFSTLAANVFTIIRDTKALIFSVSAGVAVCAFLSVMFIPKAVMDGAAMATVISLAVMAVISFAVMPFSINRAFKKSADAS